MCATGGNKGGGLHVFTSANLVVTVAVLLLLRAQRLCGWAVHAWLPESVARAFPAPSAALLTTDEGAGEDADALSPQDVAAGFLTRVVQSVALTVIFTVVPITHLWATHKEASGSAGAGAATRSPSIWFWWRPFKGGVRHVFFQALSWSFYALCCLLCALGVFFWGSLLHSNEDAAFALSSSGVLGLIAQVFMVSSFVALDRRPQQDTYEDSRLNNFLTRFAAKLRSIGSQTRSFLSMNFLLILIASAVAVLAEHTRRQPDGNSRLAGIEAIVALALFTIVLFNTYGLGGRIMTHGRWRFFQPLVGGAKFVTLQILSWGLFGVSVVIEIIFIASTFVVGIELFVGVTAVAGACVIVAEGLMIISLFFFKPPEAEEAEEAEEAQKAVEAEQEEKESAHEDGGKDKEKDEGKNIGKATITKEAVSAARSARRLKRSRSLQAFDRVRHMHRMLAIFILCNLQYIPFVLIVSPFILCDITWGEVAQQWMLACATVAAWSLTFGHIKAVMAAKSRKHHMPRQDKMWRVEYSIVLGIVLCLPFCAAVASFFYKPSTSPVWCVVAGCHWLYIGYTCRDNPEITGSRNKLPTASVAIQQLVGDIQHYFSGSVIATSPVDPGQPYIMGFHPHGILPFTLFWLKLSLSSCSTSTSKHSKREPHLQALANVPFTIMTASVCHFVPLLRDVLQWLGGREVSREAIIRAVKSGVSALIVPGGQAEMIQSSSKINQLRLVTYHKGFVRIAIQQGVPLLPILSLGEVDLMDNVSLPIVQNWFIKRIGFPFPFLPYGLWGLPMPRPARVTVIVGAPVPVTQCDEPTDEQVCAVRDAYFAQIRELFEDHKHAAGQGHRELVLLDHDPFRPRRKKAGEGETAKPEAEPAVAAAAASTTTTTTTASSPSSDTEPDPGTVSEGSVTLASDSQATDGSGDDNSSNNDNDDDEDDDSDSDNDSDKGAYENEQVPSIDAAVAAVARPRAAHKCKKRRARIDEG